MNNRKIIIYKIIKSNVNQNSNFKKCAQIYNFKLFNIIEIMELLTKNSKLFDQEMNPQSLLQNASI